MHTPTTTGPGAVDVRLNALIERARRIVDGGTASSSEDFRAAIAQLLERCAGELSMQEAVLVRLTFIQLLVEAAATCAIDVPVAILQRVVAPGCDPAIIGRAALAIFASAARRSDQRLEPSVPGADLARRALDVINRRYSSLPLTLRAVAAEVGVSRFYLARVLTRVTGAGFRHHLHRARTMAACRLLHDANKSIKEIAYDVGYAGTRELDRNFRRQCGTTPTEFRRKCDPIHIALAATDGHWLQQQDMVRDCARSAHC
jgi:AraC-like DNA-binding protein